MYKVDTVGRVLAKHDETEQSVPFTTLFVSSLPNCNINISAHELLVGKQTQMLVYFIEEVNFVTFGPSAITKCVLRAHCLKH